MPEVWTTYLASADTRATLADVITHGGGVLVPAMDVGELGTIAMVSEPGDACTGVCKPRFSTGGSAYTARWVPRSGSI